MLISSMRVCRRSAWPARRPVRFSRRSYNGPSPPGPPTTYFQQPPQSPKPPRRILRTILWSGACAAAGAYALQLAYPDQYLGILDSDQGVESIGEVVVMGIQVLAARMAPVCSAEAATESITSKAVFSLCPTAVGHTAALPSNLPCEDTWRCGTYNFFNDPRKDWSMWTIFDGHAGPRTSHVLWEIAASIVGDDLWKAGCMTRPFVPNDTHLTETIKESFREIDRELVEGPGKIISDGGGEWSRAEIIAAAAAAFSGSCALFALFDPANSVLRVANVGDSRAVLGRWDSESGKYTAKPMSFDQTGFNPDEVARIEREHPGETAVDPATGRVHGLAVSRAFGDARWKWLDSISQAAHDNFWGPRPRPNGVIKTPPYLTAEPEVMEVQLQTEGKADFLIMASDGLWDLMSSEDAVSCVQMWLDKYSPTHFLEQQSTVRSMLPDWTTGMSAYPRFSRAANPADNDEDETYFDEREQCLKWRVSPKHFVVEDENCGTHLIKNALGGKRKELFSSVVTVQPPLSRNVRDDITVHVVFFGIDAAKYMEAAKQGKGQ